MTALVESGRRHYRSGFRIRPGKAGTVPPSPESNRRRSVAGASPLGYMLVPRSRPSVSPAGAVADDLLEPVPRCGGVDAFARGIWRRPRTRPGSLPTLPRTRRNSAGGIRRARFVSFLVAPSSTPERLRSPSRPRGSSTRRRDDGVTAGGAMQQMQTQIRTAAGWSWWGSRLRGRAAAHRLIRRLLVEAATKTN